MVDQSKIAKCPKCDSIIVTWNWFGDKSKYRNHVHECWVCSHCFHTKDKVKDGVPYEALKVLYKLHENKEPVIYTEAMRLLYVKD